MSGIEKIDKNFIVKDEAVKEGTKVYDVCDEPFSVHGIFKPTNSCKRFHRVDTVTAANVNEGVATLNTNCAGGRIRFKTNSGYIAIKAIMENVGKLSHMTLTGSAGFDLYSGKKHIATFEPKFDITDELFGEYNNSDCELREYTLNLPLYSGIKELYVILDEDAVIQSAEPYKNGKPVVFYGSSITQGACASRPGTDYEAIVSRNLGLECVNLGFSGSAKGETEMAEYIANLDMSAFIFDYDFNAPTAEHLRKTHESFFKIIRKKHPHIPIICISQPIPCHADYKERIDIIEKTVRDAVQGGDNNVYFINMSDFLEKKGVLNEASVDKCHPNDLGFYFMAEAVEKLLRESL